MEKKLFIMREVDGVLNKYTVEFTCKNCSWNTIECYNDHADVDTYSSCDECGASEFNSNGDWVGYN